MEVSGAKNIFITKCEFHDSSDELCSIVRESDYVTVSWCKFYFNKSHSHAFGGLIGNRDDRASDRGKLHVTMHHNWYAEGVRGRMPRVRYGHVHIYNNYFGSAGNGYCIGTGFECHIRLENSCFEKINNAWREQAIGALASGGEIGWKNLLFKSCSQPTYIPNKYPVFTLPYSFTMDKVEDVKRLVTDPTHGAGNRLVRHKDRSTPK
jgi:pectate lyase